MGQVRPSAYTGVVVCLLFGLFSRPVAGYVRTTTKGGWPVQWVERCILITIDGRGSLYVPIADANDALARAVKNWTSRTGSCGYLVLVAEPATRAYEVASDSRPVVVFRDSQWRRPGGDPHDPSAIGLTTVFFVDTPMKVGDGTILDADIELNGVNFTFTVHPETPMPRPGTVIADLENTLTHELGHVQGLAHTCWDHQVTPAPVDDTGATIPDCSGTLPKKITGATMYPYSSTPGEISKRTLSDDDVAGVCDVYPMQGPYPACYQQVQGGCEVARPEMGAWIAAALWVLTLLALRARLRCS
jgi:hypothetical protein